MSKITIDKDKCKGCLLCISFCPKNSLKPSKDLNKKGLPYAQFKTGSDCLGCAMCAVICPDCCIEVYR